VKRGRLVLTLALAGGAVFCSAGTAALIGHTLEVRYERDVTRMVFNDNLDLLDDLRRRAGLEADSLARVLAAHPQPLASNPYIVVSIRDHRLWYRHGDSVLFTARVATGSGKILVSSGSGTNWRFETPRGRLAVVSKEIAPVWIPPDWHYVEEATRRGLGVVRLTRGQPLPGPNGDVLTVVASDVVRRSRAGPATTIPVSEGRELVWGGNIVIPPFGTNQRKYRDVLGTHRLNLGDGYSLHGTNKPETVGQAVSHGCVRLLNDDIAWLYDNVPVGTSVFIY
jgi:hypothetical protein